MSTSLSYPTDIANAWSMSTLAGFASRMFAQRDAQRSLGRSAMRHAASSTPLLEDDDARCAPTRQFLNSTDRLQRPDAMLSGAAYADSASAAGSFSSQTCFQNSRPPVLPFYDDASWQPRWQDAKPTAQHRVRSFQLVDHCGRSNASYQLSGAVSVLVFFSTEGEALFNQPVAQLRELQRTLMQQDAGAARHLRGHLRFMAVSTTPQLDTPHHLHHVARRMLLDDAWHLLTGKAEQVQQLAHGSFFASSAGPINTHTAYLIDGQRRIRGTYQLSQPLDMARLRVQALKLLQASALLAGVAA